MTKLLIAIYITLMQVLPATESLIYDLYFQWKFLWVKCGAAYYKSTPANYHGTKAQRTDLLFTTSKRADAVFVMRDTLISYVSEEHPLYFRKGSLEGKHYTVDEVFYTYPNGKSHVRQKYLNRHGEWSSHNYESEEMNYDMLSLLNLARSLDTSHLTTGQRFQFPMATGKKVEMQSLVYRGKKDWTANDNNTYRCLVFSLLDYEEKKKEKDLLQFYVTDDKRHMPVRIDFYLRFGTAKAYLKESSNTKK